MCNKEEREEYCPAVGDLTPTVGLQAACLDYADQYLIIIHLLYIL